MSLTRSLSDKDEKGTVAVESATLPSSAHIPTGRGLRATKDTNTGDVFIERDVVVDGVFGEISEDGPNYRGLGWIRASVLMIKSQVGLGVLGIPSVLSTFGLAPGIVLLFVVGFLTTWLAYWVGEFKKAHPQMYSPADMGFIMGGKWGREITGLFYWEHPTHLCRRRVHARVIFSFVGFVLAFLISSIRTLDKVSWIGWVGLVGILGAVITLAIAVSVQDRPSAAPPVGPWSTGVVNIAHPSFYEAINGLSTIIFSYAGAPNFVNVLAEMRRPEDYTKALIAAQSVTMGAYIIIGCVVYHYCGIYVASPALSSAGPLLAKVCYGIALPGLIVGSVLNAHMVSKYVFLRIFGKTEHVNSNSLKSWSVWLAVVFSHCLFGWIVAEAIPVFGDLISLIGALSATFMCLTLLLATWFYMNWQRVKTDRKPLWLLAVGFHTVILACVLFVQVAGTVSSIVVLNDNVKSGNTKKPFSC
ncbi:hypothetical protein JCM8097_003184 [Rhodosporidiobolus ruineniae]